MSESSSEQPTTEVPEQTATKVPKKHPFGGRTQGVSRISLGDLEEDHGTLVKEYVKRGVKGSKLG